MEKPHAVDSSHKDGLGAMPLHRLRRHAEQLATHLSAVATDLDRREATLDAERIQRDAELRSARLWIDARVGQLQEVVAQLQQHVDHIQSLSRQASIGESVGVIADQLDHALRISAHELKTLAQRLSVYEASMRDPHPHQDAEDSLARRSAALDSREQSLQRDQRALTEAYQETMEIHDATERLLRVSSRQHPTDKQEPNVSQSLAPLDAQMQKLKEAEQRLRKLYTQMTTEQHKSPRVKKMEPPSWVHERQALVSEINRLQAQLDKSVPSAAPRNAA